MNPNTLQFSPKLLYQNQSQYLKEEKNLKLEISHQDKKYQIQILYKLKAHLENSQQNYLKEKRTK